jgi:hypothetical protein
MSGGGHRAKQLFAGPKIFSAGGHPLRKFLATPLICRSIVSTSEYFYSSIIFNNKKKSKQKKTFDI